MKIVILDSGALDPGDISWKEMEKLGELIRYDRTPKESVTERIGDAEIVFTNKTEITARAVEHCPKLRWIGVFGTGYNVVDTQACKQHGILVANVPDYSTMAVAQHTTALLLEIASRVGEHNEAVHRGDWVKSADFSFRCNRLIELYGKTMGIIGFGRIGMAVGRLAKAFGMEVLAYNRSQCEEGRQIGTYVDLDTLLARSDVVSLHCPLFPETRGIINKETIARMKDGALLINTARGPLVEEADLAAALNSGKLRGAALDVVAQEPINGSSPLLTCKNCVITPHIAWAPIESRQRLL
ncbi:MAG TPA: glycerate dehydrogenase, partial [Ruminococcaceae bacterium]|nr:glycerate dehydrogenase [Oscillospiraceae bacterium]